MFACKHTDAQTYTNHAFKHSTYSLLFPTEFECVFCCSVTLSLICCIKSIFRQFYKGSLFDLTKEKKEQSSDANAASVMVDVMFVETPEGKSIRKMKRMKIK